MAIKAPDGHHVLYNVHTTGRAGERGRHRPVAGRGGRVFVHVPDENHRVLKTRNRVDWQQEILDWTGHYTAE